MRKWIAKNILWRFFKRYMSLNVTLRLENNIFGEGFVGNKFVFIIESGNFIYGDLHADNNSFGKNVSYCSFLADDPSKFPITTNFIHGMDLYAKE